jgi:hypothetical protein
MNLEERMRAFLLRSLLIFAVPAAMAQSAGTLTFTGDLTTPREYHSATLLNNGKVLITGGSAGNTAFTSAELYDPASGTFSLTGAMTAVQTGHTATLLPNGKVLIAGGEAVLNSGGAAVATAELYDPDTGVFTATGDMTTARAGHTATLLNNGKVLIAGGSMGKGLTSSAELYDPDTGTFTATGPMTAPGSETATLLANGKVLITRSITPGDHSDLYDPASGTFTRTGEMIVSYPDNGAAATLLPNGKVLIAGGETDYGFSTDSQLYDPDTATFTAANQMPDGLGWERTTLLGDGTLFIGGGGWIHATPQLSVCCKGSIQVYDPGSGTFTIAGDTPPVGGQTATLLPDGTVLLSGGFQGQQSATAMAQIYHPSAPIAAPVLFSLPGGREGAILHGATQQLVSAANPAVAGEALEIYGAGLLDRSVIPPQVSIGGRPAEVLYFGKAPGFAGLNQINVRVPSGVIPGAAVTVRLNYLSRPSNEVTIGVR